MGTAEASVRLHTGNTGGTLADGIILSVASTNDGYWTHKLYNYENSSLIFGTNSTERLRIDSSGRVGIATTPYAWEASSNSQVLQVRQGVLWDYTSTQFDVGRNYYYDGSAYKYGSSSTAERIAFHQGNHIFSNAVSGTANATLTWSERMRIDSSGRLLLGTTTEGVSGGDNFTISATNNAGMTIRAGTSDRSSIYFSDGTSGTSEYRGYLEYDHSSDYLRFGSSASERMRIDSSGNVGIGTSSITSFGPTLQVAGTDPAFLLQDTATAVDYFGTNITSGLVTSWYDDGAAWGIGTATGLAGSGYTERMRIDGSGNLYIGSSTYYALSNYAQTTGTGNWLFRQDDASSVGGTVIHTNRKGGFAGYYFNIFDWASGEDLRWFDFYKNGATFSKLQLTSNGNNIELTNQSDYRLKQDVSDYTGALEIVKQLKPKTYNWISNPEHPYKDTGFIAHELQEVLPDIVSGEKDEMGYVENLSEEDAPVTANILQPVYQSLDMTRLIPTLTAALKEAIAKIENLEQRLTDAGIA